MSLKLFIVCLNICILRGSLAQEQEQLSTTLVRTKEEENARQSRGFLYTNADTFYKNAPDPMLHYVPLHKMQSSSALYGAIPFAPFVLHKLNGGFPYMLPISNEIANQVTDPIYQNKLHASRPSETPGRNDLELWTLCKGRRAQIPSPRSCSHFINCWDGLAAEQSCPGELLFSEEGFCDFPHRVDCGRRPITSRMAACSDQYSAFRDPASCGAFFVCVNGQPVHFNCPADLHYSEKLGVCDYPYRVSCNTSGGSFAAGPLAPAPQPAEQPAAADGTTPLAPPSLYLAMSPHDARRQIEEERQRSHRPSIPYFTHF